MTEIAGDDKQRVFGSQIWSENGTEGALTLRGYRANKYGHNDDVTAVNG